MGFHKRFITKDIILSTDESHIDNLFGADALIFSDEWSSEFYELYKEGKKHSEILNILKDEFTES